MACSRGACEDLGMDEERMIQTICREASEMAR
jgi:hypothetical protein